jgi:hypothetical protein
MNRTRPTYTADSLRPVEDGLFNRRNHRDQVRRAKWNPATVPVPAAFDARQLVIPTAVAAIRKAFLLAKTGHRGWKSVQREGRFDVRQAPRISRGAQDVFKRKVGRSTTHVKVSVLIDSSGSMNNGDAFIANPGNPADKLQVRRRTAAAVFGATIATAIGTVPTVSLDVFEHGAVDGKMVIKYRWAKGTPIAVFNEAAHRSSTPAGNADGHALYAITSRMQREIKRDERGIVLLVSDGLPSQYGTAGQVQPPEKRIGEAPHIYQNRVQMYQAGQALIDAVAHARRNGIEVIGVAIDGSDQATYYGEKGVIKFDGNWTALGSALAQHVGAALAAR